MSMLDYRKEFFVKAAMHAKHSRMKDLNSLESDLMVAEHLLDELKKTGYPENIIGEYAVQMQAVRQLIKEKKMKI